MAFELCSHVKRTWCSQFVLCLSRNMSQQHTSDTSIIFTPLPLLHILLLVVESRRRSEWSLKTDFSAMGCGFIGSHSWCCVINLWLIQLVIVYFSALKVREEFLKNYSRILKSSPGILKTSPHFLFWAIVGRGNRQLSFNFFSLLLYYINTSLLSYDMNKSLFT